MQKIAGGDPRQRLIDAHRRSVEQLAAARITLYGLPRSWQGRRYLAASCFEQVVDRRSGLAEAAHQSVELGHDDGRGGYLGVTSSDLPSDLDEPVGVFDALVLVDGVPVAFRATRTRNEVIARCVDAGSAITVIARYWPLAGLALDRVTDPAPYLDGRKVMLEERSGFRL